jgi:glutathione S-transferase
MILYTCQSGKSVPALHPCGKASKALDDAGHTYDWRQVKGGTLKVWTWPSRGNDRAEVEKLSGQRAVPILVLDDGAVVVGSTKIADWAAGNPSQPASG